MAGKPFDNVSRKLRGHEAKEQTARAAQDAAADAFYRMDVASRDLALQVESFVASGEDPALARSLAGEYEPIKAEAEFRSHRYLATLDAHPVNDTTPLDKIYSATQAYRQATGDLLEWAVKLEEFLDRHVPTFARTTAALDRLGTHTLRANARLTEARAAVAALADAGIAVEEAGGALDLAQVAAEDLAAAIGKAPVPEVIALADKAALAAEAVRSAAAQVTTRAQANAEAQEREAQARAEAEARETAARAAEEARRAAELAVLAEGAPKRMSSLRTRREALAFRAEKVEDTLRGLRRDWSEGNWSDVADVGHRVGEHLAGADSDLAAATVAGDAGDWERADPALRSAGGQLTAVAALLDSLMARQDLLVAARDGAGELVGQVRFKLRDAQRLVMADRTEPPQPWAGQLDALVTQLEASAGTVEGVHPNYWAYRAELAAIAEAVADLVRRFNASAG